MKLVIFLLLRVYSLRRPSSFERLHTVKNTSVARTESDLPSVMKSSGLKISLSLLSLSMVLGADCSSIVGDNTNEDWFWGIDDSFKDLKCGVDCSKFLEASSFPEDAAILWG